LTIILAWSWHCHWRISKQRFKTCGAEMLIVGKRLRDSHPSHDGKSDLVNDSSRVRPTLFVGCPRGLPILLRRRNQPLSSFQFLTESAHGGTIRTTGRCVATFQYNEGGRGDVRAQNRELIKAILRQSVPLVAFVPQGQESDGVQEHRHGWCSLCRAATSRSPDSYRSDRMA